MGTSSISGSCEFSYTVSSSFLIHTNWSVHQGDHPQTSRARSLCATLLSGSLSGQFYLVALCSTVSPHIKESAGLFWAPFTVLWSGNYLKAVIWGSGKGSSNFFTSSQASLMLSHVQCLENWCLIYFVCFSLVLDGRINIMFTLLFHLGQSGSHFLSF